MMYYVITGIGLLFIGLGIYRYLRREGPRLVNLGIAAAGVAILLFSFG